MTLIGSKFPSNVAAAKEVDSATKVGGERPTVGQIGPDDVVPKHVPQTQPTDPLAFSQTLKPGGSSGAGAEVVVAAGSLMDTRWSELDPGTQQLLVRLGGATNDQQLGDVLDVLTGDQFWA
ncbi:MAG: hypothetical protein V3T05_13855 [Myxococcota bacterium]